MRLLGTVQLLVLAALAFASIGGLIGSAVIPFVVRGTARWTPASRHRALVLIGLAPVLLTFVALLSVVLPSLLAPVWPEHDHCLVHDDVHAHLCFVHLSSHAGSWAGWALIAGVGLWSAGRLTIGAKTLARASGLLRQLSRSARFDAQRKAWVMPTAEPLCLSVGALRPRLFVSEGLLAKTSAREVEIMVAHEEAHVRRWDTLVRLLVRVASQALLPGPRRMLLAAIELSSEQACDEEAACSVGDRLAVAETLLAVERLLTSAASRRLQPLAAAFGPSSVPQRVEALLAPPRDTSAVLLIAMGLSGFVVFLLAVSQHLHHVTESALAAFTH